MSKNDDERRITTLGRPTGFLFVRDKLEPTPRDGDPMEIKASWSRFELGITEKGNGSVTVNIDPSDIQGAVDKTSFAFFKHQETLLKAKQAPDSPAYTVKFKAGNLKGMTPAEILNRDPSQKEELLVQKEYLSKNLVKFPKNKEVMDAIDEAIRLMEANKLSNNGSAFQGIKIPILVYPVKPNKKLKNKDGLIKISKLNIQYVIGAEYPVEIAITNLWAPLNNEDEPIYSQSEDERCLCFTLKHEEWTNLLHTMAIRSDSFDITHELTARKRAEAITAARQNRGE